MGPRSPAEPHRTATPLELFFDLVFVVAIAQAASGLHHGIAEAHAVEGVASFAMAFFGIWWAWMNFSWFASAYDTDDVPYRLAVFLQMTGALIFAAGVPAMLAGTFRVAVAGYVVMRLAMVAQWLRAAAGDPAHAVAARRYATGIALLQVLWVLFLWVPAAWQPGTFVLLACGELAVPAWAERASRTPWHPHHMAERYGLFTIIVLGESILAAMIAVQSALSEGALLGELAGVIVGGLLIVYSLWWLYFDWPTHDQLSSPSRALFWGYGHFLVFGAAAAVGAGLAVAVDHATHHAEIGRFGAGGAVAFPVALYLVSLWVLHRGPDHGRPNPVQLLVPGLIMLTPFTGQAVLATGVLLAALIAVKLLGRQVAA
jgi:low temperature requirement protein LtrA